MREFTKRFYELDQFLGCHFHQDWKEVLDWRGAHPTFEGVVRHYVASNPPDVVVQTIEELQAFLKLPLSEVEIRRALRESDVCYTPRARGLTDRQWLEAMLEILREPPNPANRMEYV